MDGVESLMNGRHWWKKKIKRQRRKWSIEYKKRNKKRRNGIKYGPPLRLNAVGGDCGRVIGQHASVARVRAHIKRRATSQRIAFYIAYCGQDDTWPPTLRPPLSLGLTGAVPWRSSGENRCNQPQPARSVVINNSYWIFNFRLSRFSQQRSCRVNAMHWGLTKSFHCWTQWLKVSCSYVVNDYVIAIREGSNRDEWPHWPRYHSNRRRRC